MALTGYKERAAHQRCTHRELQQLLDATGLRCGLAPKAKKHRRRQALPVTTRHAKLLSL
jgi:hypothetical protein